MRKKYYVTILLIITLFVLKQNVELNIKLSYILQTTLILIIYLYLIIYFFKLGNNIIDLSKLQKELDREKLLRSSISKLTHELKNPIAVCNGYLEMIDINNKDKFYKDLERKGNFLRGNIESIIDDEQYNIQCVGLASMFQIYLN